MISETEDTRLEALHSACLEAHKAMKRIKRAATKLFEDWIVVGKAIYGLKLQGMCEL